MTDDRYMTASGIVVVWPSSSRFSRARIVGWARRVRRWRPFGRSSGAEPVNNKVRTGKFVARD